LSVESETIPLFKDYKLNTDFLNLPLYKLYAFSGDSDLGNYKMSSGKFNFPKANTYHGNPQPYVGGDLSQLKEKMVYTKFSANKYHRITVAQFDRGEDKINAEKANYFYGDLNAAVYRYNPGNSEYI
jgi:hypothetical protein